MTFILSKRRKASGDRNKQTMTSTEFTIGLQGDGARNSSRVLRPPGGGHTDIFGGEPEPTRGRRQGYAQPPSSIGQGDEPKPKPAEAPAQNGNGALTPASDSAAEPQPQQASAPPEPKTSPVEAKAASQPAPAEPPKRVRVPPGGFSQGLW